MAAMSKASPYSDCATPATQCRYSATSARAASPSAGEASDRSAMAGMASGQFEPQAQAEAHGQREGGDLHGRVAAYGSAEAGATQRSDMQAGARTRSTASCWKRCL